MLRSWGENKMDSFQKRKQDVLSKNDKSSKQSWDEKISKLCEKINSLENYYTTSSCAGRVVIMLDKDKKQQGLFLNVYHDLISLEQIKESLKQIALPLLPTSLVDNSPFVSRNCSGSVSNKQLMKNPDDNDDLAEKSGEADFGADNIIKFKQEPCILHVACESLEDAQRLLDKAKLAGWKRSGIIASDKRFVCELNGTEKLEFLIMNNGKLLVGNEFLELIVKRCNENLEKSWGKIDKLFSLL
jgi:tRNA wybutosine-synthesizing protein 3